MPDPINITQIPAPRVELIDPRTGLMSREWFRFFNNIYTIVGANLGIVQIPNGGTGLSSYPTNGQLLIGDTAGQRYVLNTLAAGSGIGVTNGAGTIGIANTGVLSNVAGAGISVSSATGNVTIANTGVLSFNGGSTGLTPATATTGVVTLAGTLDVDNGGTGQTTYTNGQLLIGNTTGNTLTKATLTPGTGITISNGAGSITINATNTGTVTSVSVVSANGFAGTVATSTTTPAITLTTTITGILKGNGTAISAAVSGTDYAPATSGTSILYGNGAGGFSSVTIGTGVSFVGGTLSATGSGGTVTAVTGTAPIASSGGTTPAISISQATTSTNGYLSSTDWNTFNNKGSGTVTSVNASVPSFLSISGNPITTSGTLAIAYSGTALPAVNGGTGQNTYATGDILYASATNTLSKLTVGTTGYTLTVASGVPIWKPPYIRTSFTASGGQTSFTANYNVGYVQVFVNGVLLNGADYTATSGTAVVLSVAASAGDIVETIAYNV